MKDKDLTGEELLKKVHALQEKIKSLEKTVTAQSQAEESLKTSEKNLSAILEKNADGIIIVDMDGTVLYVNPAAEKLFGKSKEDFLGYSFGFPVSTDEAKNTLVIKKGDAFCEAELRVVQVQWQKHSAFQLSVRDITGRKMAEDILREKEYVLSQSQRFGHIGSWGWDLKGPIKWTDEMYHVYGVTPETFKPAIESLINLIHPEDRTLMQQWLNACRAGESPGALVFRTVLPDGSIRFIRGYGDLINDSEGRPIFMGGTAQDITESKINEDALRDSEEKFRKAFELANIGKLLSSPDGKLININDAFCKMIQYSREELFQMNFNNITHPEDIAASSNCQKDLLSNETSSCRLDKRYIKKDGGILWADVSIILIRSKDWKPIHFITNVIDITERVKMEEEIRFKNIILSTQQEASIDGILSIDENGKIISYNNRFIQIMGIPLDVIESKSDELAINSVLNKLSDPDAFLKKVNYLYEHHEETSFEEISMSDGRILERYSAPMIGQDVKYYGRIWSFRDITERKKAERMLIESEKMNEVAQLSAGVAHEFNNILAIIKSASQLLLLEESRGKIKLDDRIKDELIIIDKQTIRGADIVSNLMLFSKPSRTEKEYIFIEDIINDVLKLQKKQFEMENIDVIKNYQNKNKLLLNPGQIQQVFLNLSINARHAIMPKGKGKIEIATKNDSKNVIVTFSDNGIGMNDEVKKNIFKPFFTTKGANANDDFGLKGTGLGLAVSYRIIKEFNGSINIESKPDKGAEFIIILPLEVSQTKESLIEANEKEIVMDNSFDKKINILIVDDEMNIVDNTAKILRVYGFENIDVCYSSVQALNKFNNKKYELFFIDLLMPEIKGYVLIDKLLSNKKYGKFNIIVMSGSYNDQINKILSSQKKCFFLKKPFSSEDILKILNNIFGG